MLEAERGYQWCAKFGANFTFAYLCANPMRLRPWKWAQAAGTENLRPERSELGRGRALGKFQGTAAGRKARSTTTRWRGEGRYADSCGIGPSKLSNVGLVGHSTLVDWGPYGRSSRTMTGQEQHDLATFRVRRFKNVPLIQPRSRARCILPAACRLMGQPRCAALGV